MIMGIALLAIWTIGALLIVADSRNPSSRWASAMAFVGGFGLLAGTLNEEIRPLIAREGAALTMFQEWGLIVVDRLVPLASLICQTGLPYAYLMFAISFGNENERSRQRRWGALLLLSPVIYSCWMTPIFPELRVNYARLCAWVIPYILVASSLLIFQMWREKDPILRRSRFFAVVLVAFPNLVVMFTIYIARLIGDYGAWKYNLALTLILFIFFFVFAAKYGVLGVRLRIEQNRVTSSLRALTSGTAILNHTLKNELGKIQLIAYRLERYAEQNGLRHLSRDVEQLQKSSDHLLRMSERIHEKTQEITLRETWFSLSELVQSVMERVELLATAKSDGISIKGNVDDHLWMLGDRAHIEETLINLLQNAIEAIDETGTVELKSYFSKKYFVIAVRDTGKGIDKQNLPHIFDPFFSTKKGRRQNFGLGLAYCLQVTRKHQGLIEVDSKRNEGSTIFLYFPRKRIRRGNEGEEINDE